jgi:hypothetical protein
LQRVAAAWIDQAMGGLSAPRPDWARAWAWVFGPWARSLAQAAAWPVVERAMWFDASARVPFEQVREQDFKSAPEVSVGAYSQGAAGGASPCRPAWARVGCGR